MIPAISIAKDEGKQKESTPLCFRPHMACKTCVGIAVGYMTYRDGCKQDMPAGS